MLTHGIDMTQIDTLSQRMIGLYIVSTKMLQKTFLCFSLSSHALANRFV